MPFEKRTVMEQKLEFCMLAIKDKANISELCKRYRISRPVGYKWLKRFLESGVAGMEDLSRRPQTSPFRINPDIEQYLVSMRKENPEWGSKKTHKLLMIQEQKGIYPFEKIPCINTIATVFARNGLISEEKRMKSQHYQRFEYDKPNELWQMDFKGYFKLLDQSLCHPLTILDDHSRFNVGLFACKNEQRETVKMNLIAVFRKYGLPENILCDNGSPWGAAGQETPDRIRSYTNLEKWLIRLNINPIHGHPYHPQTQGKEERFHRTLNAEVLKYELLKNYNHCQHRFDIWREKYNCIRPHEALGQEVPASRYKQSPRPYPEVLPSIEYDSTDTIRKVTNSGRISFKNKEYNVGKAFKGEFVAIRLSNVEYQYDVYFCNQMIRSINIP
jgi:transposase InsO family protein